MARQRSSIPLASVVMIAITLVLFFIPLLNGLVGGLVGGWMAGTTSRGVKAALLPAVVVAFALWGLLAVFDVPLLFGFLAGMGGAVLVLLADLGILLGAALGGAMSERAPGARRI